MLLLPWFVLKDPSANHVCSFGSGVDMMEGLWTLIEGSQITKIIARKDSFHGDMEDKLAEEILKEGYETQSWDDLGKDHWEIKIS